MSIDKIVDEIVSADTKKSGTFEKQLDRQRRFSNRMTKSGLKSKKQDFTIPLMGRITTAQIKS